MPLPPITFRALASDAPASRRSLRAASKPAATIRRAQYAGVECLVVPVVALLGDSVVRPMGSLGPELVPASLLASIPPEIWNGRPVIPDHPGLNSANDPATLAAMSFGQVFNAQFRNNALQMEMWIDPTRAAKVGPDAQDIVDRCLAGAVVEVSVGAFVAVVERAGVTAAGVPYEYVWVDLYSDHLAALPRDVVGACSVEMGCGAPRAARQATQSANNAVQLPDDPLQALGGSPMKGKPSIVDRLMSLFRPTAAEEQSDWALRDALAVALQSVEPGFEYIPAVYPTEFRVIYQCYHLESDAMGTHGRTVYYQRTYNLSPSGEVTLNDDRVAVKRVESWVPIDAGDEGVPEVQPRAAGNSDSATSAAGIASPAAPSVLSSCQCQTGAGSHAHSHQTAGPSAPSSTPPSGGNTNMALTAEQRLARITALSTWLKLSAAGVKALEGLTDEDLEGAGKELEAANQPSTPATPATPSAPATPEAPTTPAAPSAPSTPATPTPASTPQPANLSAGAAPAAAPTPSAEDLALFRGMMDELRARDAAERTILLQNLAAYPSVLGVYGEDKLKAKTTAELRELAQLVSPQRTTLPPVDFSGMGMPRAAASDDTVPAPQSMTDALKAN